MRPSALAAAASVALASCAPPSEPVRAPTGAPAPADASIASRAAGSPEACGQSWRLEDVRSESVRVLVVCASDVRREPIDVEPMARALDPALDAAHQRVCRCAAGGGAPGSVDLVVTAVPSEGKARVEPSDADASSDPSDPGARTFAACVGRLEVTFPPYAVDACAPEKAKFVYSLSVEL